MKDSFRSPREWPLSDRGQEQARSLARDFMQRKIDQVVYSSSEAKARDTAEALGKVLSRSVQVHTSLGEIDRAPTPEVSKEEFVRLNIEMFTSPYQPIVGQESADWAKTRFVEAMREIANTQYDSWEGDRLVVAHGTVISLFLSEYNEGINPLEFWAGFNCTDFVRLSVPDFQIVEVVHQPK